MVYGYVPDFYEAIAQETCYKVRIIVPSYGKDDIKITVENDTVMLISSNRSSTDVTISCFPEDADLDHTTANIKYGILVITIPRKPKKVVEIEIDD